jgi:hypothetical protein
MYKAVYIDSSGDTQTVYVWDDRKNLIRLWEDELEDVSKYLY